MGEKMKAKFKDLNKLSFDDFVKTCKPKEFLKVRPDSLKWK